MLRKLIYKSYVIALLALVVWAAQFIWPLIWWEFHYEGAEKDLDLKKNDTELVRMQKIRHYLDNHTKIKTRDLGDIVVKEHQEKGHFHHIGQTMIEPALNGCDYCHSMFPHRKDKDARAYRNMHGYFIACETCHSYKDTDRKNLEHRWVKIKTESATTPPLELIRETLSNKKGLPKSKGNYGARITPWIENNGKLVSIINRSSRAEAQTMLDEFQNLSDGDINSIINGMHKGLNKKAYECDSCHTDKDSVLSYSELGYTKGDAKKLEDIAIASVIGKYDKFHFPNMFIRKDERQEGMDVMGF